MSIRINKRRKLRRFPVGDMRELITVHVRVLVEPDFGSAEFTYEYDAGVEEWAHVTTPDSISIGEIRFTDVNINKEATDIFVIRHETYTTENIISYQGDYYKILKIDNPERRDEYLIMQAAVLGGDNLGANQ